MGCWLRGFTVSSALFCSPRPLRQDLTGLWLAGVAAAWGFLYRIQSDNAEAGGLWADVEAEPPQGSADTSFTLFLLEKNPCTVTPEPGSKEKLAGDRVQISWRGFKKRHHKMDFREQVVPFVMAGATISCVFSLRPDCFLRLCLL